MSVSTTPKRRKSKRSEFLKEWFSSTSMPILGIRREESLEMIVYANKATGSLLGYEVGELEGSDFKKFFPSVVTTAPPKSPIVLRRKDKSEVKVLLKIEELSPDHPTYTIILFPHPDKTEKSEIADLSTKNTFITSISHELKNPLNAISMSVDLLQKYQMVSFETAIYDAVVPDDLKITLQENYFEIADALAIISNNTNQMTKLVANILDYHKLLTGKLDLDSKKFTTRDFIDASMSGFIILAKQKRLSFDYMIDPSVPTALFGDITRIEQIISNLVSNAIKFTTSGNVFLHFSADAIKDTEDQCYLHIKCTDTGPGIPLSAADKIFDEFTQFGPNEAKLHGVGLGLSIVKKLCRLMHGDCTYSPLYPVEVSRKSRRSFSGVSTLKPKATPVVAPDHPKGNTRGKSADSSAELYRGATGSVFVATLRLEIAITPRPSICSSDNDLEGKRVVLVSDDEVQLVNILRWTRDASMIATAHTNQRIAHEDIKETSADIIVVDEDMTSGRLFAERLLMRSPSTPVIVITSSETNSDNNTKFAGFITKPVKKEKLNRLYKKCLGLSLRLSSASTDSDSDPTIRILVADDNEDNKNLISRIIKKFGYTVYSVSDGSEAIEETKRTKYKVALLDINMPTDGLTTAKEILKMEKPPKLIAVSAMNTYGGLDFYKKSGFIDYISKPVNVEKLRDLLSKYTRED